VEDREKNVLESFGSRASGQALNNQAAQTLLDVLRGTIDTGTAVGLRPRFGLNGMDLAGKTGTTQDNTDGWFILMHPQLVAGAWMGFNDNRVTMRSEYWGQGAHNALFVVGDFLQQSVKAGKLDPKAAFAAPRVKDEPSLLDRAGDWWNSVFSTPSPATDPTVAAVPEVKLPEVSLEPPSLEPPPKSLAMPAPLPLPPVTPDAPVVSEPQRVPSFPRPLESAGRPVETVPGTQVYRVPEATVRMPDPSLPADVVRAPAQPARVAPPPAATTSPSTSSMGAARDAVPASPPSREFAPVAPARPRMAPIIDGEPTGNLMAPAPVSEASGSATSPAPDASQ